MQIVSSILAGITWNPELPRFLVDLIALLGSVFSIDLGGLLSSPECSGAMAPLSLWYMSMALPWGIAFLFLIWAFLAMIWSASSANRRRYRAATMETIMHGAVQTLYVGLFKTVITTCFKIFDCDKGKLVMDASVLCPLEGGDGTPAYFSLAVSLIYGILPSAVLFGVMFPYCIGWRFADELEDRLASSHVFRIVFGWSFQKYDTFGRQLGYIWEIFNTAVKMATVAASVLMFKENRAITLLIVTGVSFVAHLSARPYKDGAGNVTVVLFCVCDFLGILSSRDGAPTALQVAFVVSLGLTLFFVCLFASMATHRRIEMIRAAAMALRKRRHRSIWASYSNIEIVSLFPILIMVWIATTMAAFALKCCACCVCPCGMKKNNKVSQTKIAVINSAATTVADEPDASEYERQRAASLRLRETRVKFGADSPEYARQLKIVRAAAGVVPGATASSNASVSSITISSSKVLPVASTVEPATYSPEFVFTQLDMDNTGTLGKAEVRVAVDRFVPEMTDAEFDAVFAKMDKNNDGSISLKEFKKGLFYKQLVFQMLDADLTGSLDREEVRAAYLHVLGVAISDADFEVAIAEMDKDADGRVSFKEFKKAFSKKKHGSKLGPKEKKEKRKKKTKKKKQALAVDEDPGGKKTEIK
jgi:Ca2+-binding EF-hand superfamily protein